MSSSHSDALDETAVSELMNLDPDGSSGLLPELIGLFESDGKLHISTISEASSAESVRNAAHALKGTSATVGAHRLSALASRIESGEVAPNADVVAALDTAHEQAVAALRAFTKSPQTQND